MVGCLLLWLPLGLISLDVAIANYLITYTANTLVVLFLMFNWLPQCIVVAETRLVRPTIPLGLVLMCFV